jgi:hypothetical protein
MAVLLPLCLQVLVLLTEVICFHRCKPGFAAAPAVQAPAEGQ